MERQGDTDHALDLVCTRTKAKFTMATKGIDGNKIREEHGNMFSECRTAPHGVQSECSTSVALLLISFVSAVCDRTY